jgi:hypothetical protein
MVSYPSVKFPYQSKTSKCSKIIDEVYNVVKEYETLVRSVNIKERTIKLITNIQKE